MEKIVCVYHGKGYFDFEFTKHFLANRISGINMYLNGRKEIRILY